MIKRIRTSEEWKNIIGKLSPEKFEHLCYQLVKAMHGFVNVDLREGSYDSGRDIDATYRGKAPDGITEITEKWRFECKKYSRGIPFDDISGKIKQADLNRINTLVILSNMHLTPACKDEFEKIQNNLNCNIINWTGVHFIDILFQHPDIRKEFFPDEELPQRFSDTKQPQELAKILKFLEKIGSHRIVYGLIEKLYVEPENYNEIVEILKKYNIVFIIGDAEIGKTYTAIKLLFEFYKQGYEPQHIPEEYRKEQRCFIRHEGELEGRKAVYLEDPWGKVEFQGKESESVFREIGDFIINVKKKKCKIIITSREKVFKEFEKTEKTTDEDLWQYVSNLKVNLAYTTKELKEMLDKYIGVFDPEWSKKEELRENVFRAVGEKLKTPMSISKMIAYTEDALDEDSLMDGIERASKETKIEFAKEIRELFNKGQYDKIVFLSFPYIGIGIETAKSAYNNCLKDLGYSLRDGEFETLLEDSKEVESLFGRLRFKHPSYWEAFSYALIDNDRLSNICKKIFFKVSISLAKEDDVSPLVIWMVSPDFDKLLRDDRPSLDAVTHALLGYANELENYGGVARIGADWISDNRNWILDIIAEHITRNVPRTRIVLKPLTKGVLTIPTNKMVNYIAEKLRNDVGQKYEDVGKTVRDIVKKLKSTKLSTEDVKKWIFEVAELHETIGKVIKDIAAKLWLSNEVVFKVAEKYEVAGEYARTIAENFDLYVIDKPPFRIDKDFKDLSNFLLVLAEREEVARSATGNLDKLPIEIKIKLIELISTTILNGTLEGPNVYKSFAFEILDKLSKDESEEVKNKVEVLMRSSSNNFKSGK
jgi:response regulator RpfG family c-di-GMP phosphodiesterase